MRILLSLIVFGCVFAANGQKNTLLYSIKGEGVKTSYVFGTVHLIADTAFEFSNKLEKTVAKTDELVLEIGDINNQTKAIELLKLSEGSAFDIFSPAQKDSVLNWGATLLKVKPEVVEKAFEKKEPFALIQVATQATMKVPVRSFEYELINQANLNKQTISGLETMEFQISVFKNMPDSVMREMIMDMIRHPEKQDATSVEMTQLYLKRDVEAIAKLITESNDIGNYAEQLVFQRNRNWIPVMKEKMTTKSCFFAVGAGHLGGTKGIIALLQEAGYTVTPISY